MLILDVRDLALLYLDVMALGHHHIFLGKELLDSVWEMMYCTWLSDATRCWTIWPSAVVISWM